MRTRSRTVKYTAGEIGRVRVVEDFLPAPDALVLREENVKVTLSLSKRSVDFFKHAAKARALSAYDPRAGGCLCGEAGGEIDRTRHEERRVSRSCSGSTLTVFSIFLFPINIMPTAIMTFLSVRVDRSAAVARR